MTPRGLKIRLDLEWGFSLLNRLWEKDRRTDAFRVLKTCEAIEHIPMLFSVLAGLVALVQPKALPGIAVAMALVVGRVGGILLTSFGRFDVLRPVGLVVLGTIWAQVPFGGSILLGIPLVTGMLASWNRAAYWVAGYVAAVIAQSIADAMLPARQQRLTGQPFTTSEVDFFNAFRLHADRVGVSRDIDVGDEEASSGGWRKCLEDYATKWPEAVARFPLTPEDQAVLRASADEPVEWPRGCRRSTWLGGVDQRTTDGARLGA